MLSLMDKRFAAVFLKAINCEIALWQIIKHITDFFDEIILK